MHSSGPVKRPQGAKELHCRPGFPLLFSCATAPSLFLVLGCGGSACHPASATPPLQNVCASAAALTWWAQNGESELSNRKTHRSFRQFSHSCTQLKTLTTLELFTQQKVAGIWAELPLSGGHSNPESTKAWTVELGGFSANTANQSWVVVPVLPRRILRLTVVGNANGPNEWPLPTLVLQHTSERLSAYFRQLVSLLHTLRCYSARHVVSLRQVCRSLFFPFSCLIKNKFG